MDWSKAKNILIVLFAFLNIFLFILIGKYYFNKDATKESIANTVALLEARGVKLKCEIPVNYQSDIGTLSFDLNSANLKSTAVNKLKTVNFIDDNTFIYKTSNIMKGIDITDTSAVLKYIKELVYEIIPVSRFQLDSVTEDEEGGYLYVLNERYKNYIVFDNYLKLHVENNGDFSFECRYRKINNIVSIKKILPCYQVLIKNFNKKDQSVIITAIDLGFKENVILDGAKSLNDIPVWRVRLESGEEIFYKAYSGETIKSDLQGS